MVLMVGYILFYHYQKRHRLETQLPDITLVNLDGSDYLPTVHNKPFVYTFIKPDCHYCLDEVVDISTQLIEEKPVDVFFISAEPLDVLRDLAAPFETHKVRFLQDKTQKLSRYYAVTAFPTTIVFSKEGLPLKKFDGTVDLAHILQALPDE
ncbi:hypothetical protein FACS1894201_06350 [Bacteroidia bacterium]|nr:hypothetical protein FACS1894201_06350 [Bacteroidia bacterium]